MIRSGFVIESPRTGAHITVLESDAENGGAGWLLEVRCKPGAGPDITPHLHTEWTETFEILSGSAYYELDGARKQLGAGESFTVQPRQVHVHPWCVGAGEMVYRQRDTFARPSPAAVQEVLGVFATLAALTRQGKTDQRGLPTSPLQLAATMRTLVRHGGYDAKAPIWLQNLLAATLGRLAEARGYRGVYPEYVA